ncbi:biotin/lipoate A/B protein ligase family protein [Acidobacteriota bacterium]
MKKWPLIVDKEPLSGSWNMAVDDYLFRSLGEKPQTTVRFYSWKRPTASLGYSQKTDKVLDVRYCRNSGIDVVRRITGGKMVLHFREVTYSICSSDSSVFTDKLSDSYRLISEALMKGLEKMGLHSVLAEEPPSTYARSNLPCFSYPARNEVEVKNKKVIGSAQKRVGSTFLQHGSIPLEDDRDILKKISFLEEKEEDVRLISLSQALGTKVKFEWAVDFFVTGISEYFNVEFMPRILTENEKEAVTKIQTERYNNPKWTFNT